MFSILDMPYVTTLEQAREAIRFGGINLSEVVDYLDNGSVHDRLAQAGYYKAQTRKAEAEKWLGRFALTLLALAGIAFVVYQIISGGTP